MQDRLPDGDAFIDHDDAVYERAPRATDRSDGLAVDLIGARRYTPPKVLNSAKADALTLAFLAEYTEKCEDFESGNW